MAPFYHLLVAVDNYYMLYKIGFENRIVGVSEAKIQWWGIPAHRTDVFLVFHPGPKHCVFPTPNLYSVYQLSVATSKRRNETIFRKIAVDMKIIIIPAPIPNKKSIPHLESPVFICVCRTTIALDLALSAHCSTYSTNYAVK